MSLGAVGRSVVVATLAVVALGCSPSVALPSQSTDANATPTPASLALLLSASPSVPAQTAAVAGFPAQAFGLPVISVGDLNRLISSGGLDGRVAAVAGYWESSIVPSCPAPGRWMSPLEGSCEFDLFSDTPYPSATCQSSNSCSGGFAPPGAETVKALTLDNYVNYERIHSVDRDHYFDPHPMVLIGHAADPRWLQCQSDVERQCQTAFVIDTVAWSAGQTFDLALQDDPYSPKPTMTIEDVAAAIGNPNLVSVALTTADDVNSVDPRINVAGTNLAWVVRGRTGDPSDSSSAADVWAVDDRDGSVIGHEALTLAPDYHPAFLTTQALVHGYDSAGNGPYPFFGVDYTGSTVHQSMMGAGGAGGSGDSNGTRFYSGGPLLLTPGEYVLRSWRSTIDHPSDVVGAPQDNCASSLTLAADQRVTMEADFPVKGQCSWGPPTFPSSMFDYQ